MKWLTFLSLFVLALHQNVDCVNTRFQERYSWRYLDFQFPDERTRQSLLSSREYIPSANVPLGTEIWRDRFFVSVPRWLPGIISTLNYFSISASRAGSSPRLIPYPNFESNRIRPNQTNFNNSIISVFRMKVDACDRLWFVDTGIDNFAGTTQNLATARLFIIDLRTDRLIRRYTFDTSVAPNDSVMGGNIEVDVTADNCDRAFAYMPDFSAYRLVVYSYEQNSAWRIRHPYFYFDPFASPFYIGGLTFLWVDGVFGASLSTVQSDGFRILYFSSISTNYQFAVSTRYLRDRDLATNTTTLLQAYRFLGTRGPNMQTTAHALHQPTGTLFYTLANRNGIGCWNSYRFPNNYSPDTNFILATDDVTMIFPNDIIFDESENIWLLSDRLPVSNIQGLRENEVNFRLFVAPVRDVIRGTVCENINGSSNSNGNFNSGGSGSNFNSGGNSGSGNFNSGGSNSGSNFNSGSNSGSNFNSGSNSGSNFNSGSNSGSNSNNFGNSGGSGFNSGSGSGTNFGSASFGGNDNVNFPQSNRQGLYAYEVNNSGLRVDNINNSSSSNSNKNRPPNRNTSQGSRN
ncbi:protein yellow-like [Planococcus citri]|uniref:protein yellow-like n=1 Tax=Planococcus citri TaxID=170843 RepID=UPI0031F727B9